MLNRKAYRFVATGIVAAAMAGCGAMNTSSLNDTLPPLETPLKGIEGSTTIQDKFEGEYLLIDLSGANCPYCRTFAKQLQGDSEFQSIIKDKKCSTITVVSNLNRWNSISGFNDFTKSHSFTAAGGLRRVASAFKAPFRGSIPFVFIVDKQGKLALQGANRDASLQNFKNACKDVVVEPDVQPEIDDTEVVDPDNQ